jgi:hypothetical protein
MKELVERLTKENKLPDLIITADSIVVDARFYLSLDKRQQNY